MIYTKLKIPDVILIQPDVFGDERGYFMETWRDNEFREKVADVSFVQDNQSKSQQGILRGLHYQLQQTQGKLVRVISGTIFDIAVDIRKSSATFGQWLGVSLSADSKQMLWVPPGFAHGFYVVSEAAEFVYKCTDYYAPEFEKAIAWDDPSLNIEWPLVNNTPPMLSAKDQQGSLLKDAEVFN